MVSGDLPSDESVVSKIENNLELNFMIVIFHSNDSIKSSFFFKIEVVGR